MDKLQKELKKLNHSEQKIILDILERLYAKQTIQLDIKKLKGRDDIYRVRKGALRVIYKKDKTGIITIISVGRRSEKTYNF